MQRMIHHAVDLLVWVVLLVAGLSLAWLGDYRGREIVRLQKQALLNHERLIRQNTIVINHLDRILPGLLPDSETTNGPGQNR